MKLFNTLARKKEEFVPIKKGEVRMYVCGPTVYNFFHIGNARPFIVFDALRSYFEYLGNKVIFVQNFTDVDDKIINKAREEGLSTKEVTERYIEEYYKDARALKINDASVAPRATETIEEIIGLIEDLVDKGYAYNKDGNVYYRTKKFKQYGKLSHLLLDDLEAGARVEKTEEKEDEMDFALWKKPKSETEIAWDSPWGKGRPGWHIECSAMAKKYLGETIDIHCGGQDLIFPHHENEIAQSEAANGCDFAHYWLHNGFINIDNQKMSKSLGNFWTVRDILEQVKPEVVRFFMLSNHYRNPMNFSFDLMKSAENGLDRIKTCVDGLKFLAEQTPVGYADTPFEKGANSTLDFSKYKKEFLEALDDDFNTASAISIIFDLVRDVNSNSSQLLAVSRQEALDLIRELCGILRILPDEKESELDGEIQKLIDERDKARAEKDFAKSDEIRDKLAEMGIVIKDTPQGTQVVK